MNRGSLLDAIDRGLLTLPSGRPNLHAVMAAAIEMAGALSYLHSCEVIHGARMPARHPLPCCCGAASLGGRKRRLGSAPAPCRLTAAAPRAPPAFAAALPQATSRRPMCC